MLQEGAEKYGIDSYGLGGSIIDTNYPFRVESQLLSTNSYQELYGVKTVLSQNGRTMELQTDCWDYVSPLSQMIEAGAHIRFSMFENTDPFNQVDECPEAHECGEAFNRISDIEVWQWGYNNEDP